VKLSKKDKDPTQFMSEDNRALAKHLSIDDRKLLEILESKQQLLDN